MPRFGWEGAFGLAEESVFGTGVTPNRFWERSTGEVTIEDPPYESSGITGGRSRQLSQTTRGLRDVSYSVAFPMGYVGQMLGVLTKHALGSVTTTEPQVGIRWLHTFNLADALPVGLTLEGEWAPKFVKLLGGRVDEWMIESTPGREAMLTVSGPAQDYQFNDTGATFSPPSGQILTMPHEAALLVNAVAKQYRSFRLRCFNNLFREDYRSGARTIFSAAERPRRVDGQFVLTADEAAEFLKYRDFTSLPLNLKFTGPALGTDFYSWEFDLPKIRYTAIPLPLVGPDDENLMAISFIGYKDASNELTAKLQNGSSTL